jgi:hypothetical protein
MSITFSKIQILARNGEILISEHGYDELVEDGLSAREVIAGIEEASLIEDYPDYHKGPCVLVFQKDKGGSPIHVVWGISKGNTTPAVLITAYRPDPERWTADFMRRKK